MALHTRDRGLVVPTAWDGPSALMLADIGFEAIAATSAASAAALSRPGSGQHVSRAERIGRARLIGQLTGLPVNGDFHDDYGGEPEDVTQTVEAAATAGLAGIGINDTSGNPDQPIHDFDDAVNRVCSAVRAAKRRIVVTGGTCGIVQGEPRLDETIRRLTAFAEVGADVLYAPCASDIDAVAAIAAAVAPRPVSALISSLDGVWSFTDLRNAGVKRITVGPTLHTQSIEMLRRAIEAHSATDLSTTTAEVHPEHIDELLALVQRIPPWRTDRTFASRSPGTDGDQLITVHGRASGHQGPYEGSDPYRHPAVGGHQR
ncbi:isocitrate lyase/phosphoenolpyruvate mutase family protein [Streptomyces tendae]|uniref:isocitrate lyase/phosphoenolpyruvate mutase family protein n=1 Tax=Streptomyces tendae TaxID=1932 RepID=UPI0033DD716B